jgi:hypothetical protein
MLEENFRENITKQQQDALQNVQKYFDTAQTASVAALEFIKSAALDEIRKIADDKKQELLQLSQQQHKYDDDILFKGKDFEKIFLTRYITYTLMPSNTAYPKSILLSLSRKWTKIYYLYFEIMSSEKTQFSNWTMC